MLVGYSVPSHDFAGVAFAGLSSMLGTPALLACPRILNESRVPLKAETEWKHELVGSDEIPSEPEASLSQERPNLVGH